MYKPKEDRGFVWCQHCGNDKPWNVLDWVVVDGQTFCSHYCMTNFQAFLFRMAQKKRKVV